MLRRSLSIWQAINVASAVKWEGAKSTNGANLVTSTNPRPTAIAELVKRDAWPVSYCGFIGGTSCRCPLPIFVNFSGACHVMIDDTLMICSSGSYLLRTLFLCMEYRLFRGWVLCYGKPGLFILYIVYRRHFSCNRCR